VIVVPSDIDVHEERWQRLRDEAAAIQTAVAWLSPAEVEAVAKRI
jgi:hypothetical protein